MRPKIAPQLRPKIAPQQIQAFKDPMKEIAAVVHEIQQLTPEDEARIPDERTAVWADRIRAATNLLDPAFRESDDIKRLLSHDALGSLEIFYRVIPKLNKLGRSETFTIENIQEFARNALWIVLTSVESLEYWTGKPLQTQASYADELVHQGAGFLRKAVKHRSDETSLGIIVPELRAVSIHRGTIGILLSNMVSNAVKHGKATDVTILGYQGAGHADLVVVDNGKGIEQEVADRIFEYGFSAGEGLSSGIGLAEADKRLRAMDGRLFVNGHGGLNGGAEFVMRLPEVPLARQKKC